MTEEHQNKWTKYPGSSLGKILVKSSSQALTNSLLQLERKRLRRAIALRTGHGSFRKHLQTVGLFQGDPICKLCKQDIAAAAPAAAPAPVAAPAADAHTAPAAPDAAPVPAAPAPVAAPAADAHTAPAAAPVPAAPARCSCSCYRRCCRRRPRRCRSSRRRRRHHHYYYSPAHVRLYHKGET